MKRNPTISEFAAEAARHITTHSLSREEIEEFLQGYCKGNWVLICDCEQGQSEKRVRASAIHVQSRLRGLRHVVKNVLETGRVSAGVLELAADTEQTCALYSRCVDSFIKRLDAIIATHTDDDDDDGEDA